MSTAGTPDHPISAAPAGVRVRAELQGRVFMDAARPVALKEADYPTVYYAPPSSMSLDYLRKSDTVTHCPFKGDATHYHAIGQNGELIEDAFWCYEAPKPGLEAIAGYFAPYPDRLELIRETPDGNPIV